MPIRAATAADVATMVELSDAKRTRYAQHSPVFWRKAPEAAEKQARFFASQLTNERALAVVHEEGGRIEGFLIASLTVAPPVYDPGGPVCVIDDFVVERHESAPNPPPRWYAIGCALLARARAWARERGAAAVVVVCGHHDEPKRALLQAEGLGLTSEWYVQPL